MEADNEREGEGGREGEGKNGLGIAHLLVYAHVLPCPTAALRGTQDCLHARSSHQASKRFVVAK